MNRHRTFSVFAVAMLTACSKGPHDVNEGSASADAAQTAGPSIDFVKDQPSTTPGLTMGQIFDHNPNCPSHQWSVAQDNYGRDVVTFRCAVKPSPELLTSARQTAITTLRSSVANQAKICSVDGSTFIEQRTHDLEAYYGRFNSVSEVMEFVVNQGQVVEKRAGILDGSGQSLPLNDIGIAVVSLGLEVTGDGQRALDNLYEVIASGGPRTESNCDELRRLQSGTSAAGGLPSQSASDAGLTTDPGDAEPEPKGQ